MQTLWAFPLTNHDKSGTIEAAVQAAAAFASAWQIGYTE
jgi:hypothetical protein